MGGKNMLSKKTKIFAVVIAFIILIILGYVLRIDRFGLMEIDYVDCVYINNQLYTSGINPNSRIPVDSTLVGQKIGEVRFTLSDHVHSSLYINRNGDAAFLEIGTEIYSIKSQNDAVAVKIGQEYYIFKNGN